MRPCTFSDRLCILPMLVTAQRPERPQTNKSAATAFARKFERAISHSCKKSSLELPRRVSPRGGRGGQRASKRSNRFSSLQGRSILRMLKCFQGRSILRMLKCFLSCDRYCGRSLVRRSSCWAIAVEVKKGYNCPGVTAIAPLKMRVKRVKQGQSTNPEMLTIRQKSLFSSVF